MCNTKKSLKKSTQTKFLKTLTLCSKLHTVKSNIFIHKKKKIALPLENLIFTDENLFSNYHALCTRLVSGGVSQLCTQGFQYSTCKTHAFCTHSPAAFRGTSLHSWFQKKCLLPSVISIFVLKLKMDFFPKKKVFHITAKLMIFLFQKK